MDGFRFGKHPPRIDYRTLRLADYLTARLPAPPASVDNLARVYRKLGVRNPRALFPMDGNDRIGDCTIAALAHAVTTYRGLVGRKSIMAQPDVEKLYWHLTGGVDSGLSELDVLSYWRSHAAGGEKILAYVAVNAKNKVHVQQAIELFGGVYLGFQVQASCLRQFKAKKPWTPGPLTNDGHAVFATGYDATGVTVLTWGNTQKGTWDWWMECVDEAYAILPQEAKQSDFDPGFDFAQLREDLQAVAN